MSNILHTRFGKLEFESGYPTDKTTQQLYEELDFQRAVQAYIWALPMASYGAMADEYKRLGTNDHTVLIADNSAEQQHLVLTANQDTIYMSGVLDLREGPIVMEMPGGLLGTLNNIWQQSLSDLGGPYSPEQNHGGRFLVLPPDYQGPLPEMHYHVVRSDTNIVNFYLRALPKTRADFPALVEHMKKYRQYKLSDITKPPETGFILMSGIKANFLTNEGFAYFEALERYIKDNPPRPQDMAMLGMLETLGIAHGKPFNPDAQMKRILTEAAETGRAMAKAIAWRPRIAKELLYIYPDKRHWENLFFGNVTFHEPEYMAIDQRAKFAFDAAGTAKSMSLSVPGVGSKYAMSYQDAKGNWLSGEHTYKMYMPEDVPANNFWSITLYDNETRSLIQNDLPPEN